MKVSIKFLKNAEGEETKKDSENADDKEKENSEDKKEDGEGETKAEDGEEDSKETKGKIMFYTLKLEGLKWFCIVYSITKEGDDKEKEKEDGDEDKKEDGEGEKDEVTEDKENAEEVGVRWKLKIIFYAWTKNLIAVLHDKMCEIFILIVIISRSSFV